MRERMSEPGLKFSHILNPRAFSRTRKLDFKTVVGLILQKGVKSLQVKLNEYFPVTEDQSVSASAFSQARANLSHSIFIELNSFSYAKRYYSVPGFETYNGHRLLAVDGSKIRLPDTAELREEFGQIRIKNQHGTGSYTGSLCSVLYDVLNEIVIDGILAPGNASEISLAKDHLQWCKENDVVLFDRNYPGYELFAGILARKANFICRCPSNAFNAVKDFIANPLIEDTLVTLSPSKELKSKVLQGELPEQLIVRLIKVLLSTGEIEILATSLLDQEQYPISDFKELYALRWNVETLFDRFKNRLALENFTGYSIEAVKQDFYSTVLISNVESELTAQADQQLKKKPDNKYPQKVNKTISFNLIKHHAMDLLFDTTIKQKILVKKLNKLFMQNPIPIRNSRSEPRKRSSRRSLDFHRRTKKIVF